MSVQTNDNAVWLECDKCRQSDLVMKSPERDSRLEAVRVAIHDGWSVLDDGNWAKCPDCRNYGSGYPV